MERFNLDTWLQDKSRKICTRDGRPVRIICTDRKGKSGNIVGLVGKDESLIYVWNNDGKHIVSEIPDNDLFFADEEELTEFEKELVDLVSGWCDSHIETPEEYINKHSQLLLDLARKEIEKENPYNENQKQEWSEEDSERLLRIHQFIWANRKGDTDEIYQQEQDADWLMSIIPQQNQYDKGYNDGYSAAKYNQWKPTDKQMGDFRMLLDYNIGVFDYAKFMSANSLYDDLKKNLID